MSLESTLRSSYKQTQMTNMLDWITSNDVIEFLIKEFIHIDLELCAGPNNNRLPHYWTEARRPTQKTEIESNTTNFEYQISSNLGNYGRGSLLL